MNLRLWSYVICSVSLCVVVVTSGCGGGATESLVEVTGTVSYRGRPVPNANVTLQPQGAPAAMGVSDEQGRFSLATRGRPGAVPGPASVAITAVEELKNIPPSEEHPEGYTEVRWLIPEKYGTLASSPLQVEVSGSEANHLDLDLD